ncbi:beta-propeller domain-containing protein [Planococcus shenhongbingii]|uniref:Beta-propeller domain-containing protein n=1 Tax=Planococcus shenhongbingii TaxID=3058398 RepID=A0ABT8NAE0_9BACL|nr:MULTISPECIES: beta-propeller domain-containing protein [unclassified Planococcus (in: firmicutes)]MDN7244861.1 beta-propeller domain-containing protein [Planococcus sp. N017]WKA57978.1 beta-propeller domain-containing protein [Planococcus sp. N016]
MKKRSIWLIVAAAVAAIALSLVFIVDKVSVSASSIALAEQGWQANFSSALHPDAVKDGDLYITNENGEPVEVEMALNNNGKTVEIPQIPVGEYKLHIKKSALKGNLLKSLDVKEIAFSVQEEITALTSEEELKAYFAQLLALQKNSQQPGLFNNEGGAVEESAESGDASRDSSSGGEHSTTNNQVEGVDEADMVKTDGSFIYSISESQVIISDVRKPDAMTVASDIKFQEEMYPQQLFLSGDTLIVIGSRYSAIPFEDTVREFQPHIGLTSVFLYDISNPAEPQLIREFGTEGSLNSARLANNILYYVTNVYPDFWTLEEQSGVELRPHTYDSNDNNDLKPMPYENISILPGTMEGSYSIISAIDLAEPAQNTVSTKGFLGGSEQLYMTEESMYLTAAKYMPVDEENVEDDVRMSIWLPQLANTEIFKFTLDGTDVQFLSSSEVTGTLLNQFSMDEHNGYFRIVTTEGIAWDEAAPSKNHLFILDSGMKQVGSVEDLAKGERIYSARFIGDKAYMVTFKETDPLFVIDVSAPTAPKVLGELKIPGFSNYLHPLDENHLIGFGYDTKLEPVKDGEPRIVTGGMKISLFDVSDFSNPLEKDTEILGGPGTYSPLQYDHKALYIHPETDLFGFPVTLYGESDGAEVNFEAAGAMIYTITPEGITETANLMTASEMPYEDWETSVQRIVSIGDTLYTVANSEVKSYSADTFDLLQTLNF